MPRSPKITLVLLLALFLLLLAPIIGQIVAVIIVFLLALPLGLPILFIMKLCEQFGLRQHTNWIVAAVVAAVALASASYFAFQLHAHRTSPNKHVFLNGMILTLGTPAILLAAIFQLRELFPATFHH